jgi:hypothetical protein
MQPREQALDFPSTVLVPQLPDILGQSSEFWCKSNSVVRASRCRSGSSALIGALVGGSPINRRRRSARNRYSSAKFSFMRRSASINGRRKIMVVAAGYDLLHLPRRVGLMAEPSFFAELKPASTSLQTVWKRYLLTSDVARYRSRRRRYPIYPSDREGPRGEPERSPPRVLPRSLFRLDITMLIWR